MNRKQEIAEFVSANYEWVKWPDQRIECFRLVELWDAAHRPKPPTPEQRKEIGQLVFAELMAPLDGVSWLDRAADKIIDRYGPPPASEPKEKCGECEAVKVLSEVLHQVAGVLDDLDIRETEGEGVKSRNLSLMERMRILADVDERLRKERDEYQKGYEEQARQLVHLNAKFRVVEKERDEFAERNANQAMQLGAINDIVRSIVGPTLGTVDAVREIAESMRNAEALANDRRHEIDEATAKPEFDPCPGHPFDKHIGQAGNPVEAKPEAQ